MSTRQVESTHEAEPNHPVPEQGAAAVESPSGDKMQGANGLPHDTNADDVDPGAGDQDIDTAGTEADEQSVVYNALGFPRSDEGPPKPGDPSDDAANPAKVL